MKKTFNIVIIAVFLCFIGAFFILNIAMPDVEFSQQENRYLQQMPDFSLDRLFSGSFTSDFEKYTTDQFAFRDKWTALKAGCELATGKKENNGVYYCGDDVLINDFDAPADDNWTTRVSNVNNLNETLTGYGIPLYFGLIPGAVEIESAHLPANAPADSQQTLVDQAYGMSEATNIDIASALGAHKDEYIYYRTDHHWTSLGAYYGYEAICAAMGLPAPDLSSYDRQVVSQDFYGTVYSSSGFSWVEPDEIETFVPDDGTVTVMDYNGAEPTAGPLYDTSFLDVKDKYSMFLGGVSPLRSVETGRDGPSLLIIRDSFSDSLLPFLTANFSRIDLMDMRYYKQSPAQYAVDNDFDAVLVLYSVDNFATDQNLFMLSM